MLLSLCKHTYSLNSAIMLRTCAKSYRCFPVFFTIWSRKPAIKVITIEINGGFLVCVYHLLFFVLLCPLRFPHENDVRFFFTSMCLYEVSCLIYVICYPDILKCKQISIHFFSWTATHNKLSFTCGSIWIFRIGTIWCNISF